MAFPIPSDDSVRQLTQHQRDVIISHVDGPVQCTVHDSHLAMVRNSLIRQGLLRGCGVGRAGLKRPRTTELTERGRMVLGMILAWYADSLVRAGFVVEKPMQVLTRLHASGTFARNGDDPRVIASTRDGEGIREAAVQATDLIKTAPRRRIR